MASQGSGNAEEQKGTNKPDLSVPASQHQAQQDILNGKKSDRKAYNDILKEIEKCGSLKDFLMISRKKVQEADPLQDVDSYGGETSQGNLQRSSLLDELRGRRSTM